MKLKTILPILILLIVAIAGSFLFVQRQDQIKKEKQKLEETLSFISDLETSLENVTNDIEGTENLHYSYNSYYIKNSDNSTNLNINELGPEPFFLASTIKPLFITAYLKTQEIEDLNYEISFKFLDEQKQKKSIASELFQHLAYGYSADVLITDSLAPLYKDKEFETVEDVYNLMITDPTLKDLKFPLKTLIEYSLGPSSNWAIALFRQDLAFRNNFTTEGEAADVFEEYLNNFLPETLNKNSVRIIYSRNAKIDETINSAHYKEFNYLFDAFLTNKFDLKKEIFELMTTSMTNVAEDPKTFNRRHEIKSIIQLNNIKPKTPIIEKSGYIGLDYESAPGLMKDLDLETLPKTEDKRYVVYFANTFAKVQLNNGYSVIISYQISKPIELSLDPHYEELNNDYLKPKNEIFAALESNIGKALVKNRDLIE